MIPSKIKIKILAERVIYVTQGSKGLNLIAITTKLTV